jgi:PAS domain S-box-containing protein
MLSTIRARLVLLALLTVVPFVAITGHAAATAWRSRQQAELTANLELARTAASFLRTYVDDVLHESLALGNALATGSFDGEVADALLARSVVDRASAVRELDWLFLDGRIARSSNPASVGVSLADRSYVQRILHGEEAALSDLALATDNRPVFAIARGIRLPGRGLVGIVVAVVDPDRLGARALPFSREGDAAVAILDRAGRIVLRAPALDLAWRARQVASGQPIVLEALAGREATGAVRAEGGDERLGAAVPVAPHGWVVRASRSTAETLGPVRREILLLILVGAVVSALVLGLATLIGRRTAGSLRRLEAHALALGRGEAPPPLSGPAELTRLGRAHEAMARELHAARRRFEAVFEDAPAGVLVLDAASLRARYANRTYLGFLDEPFRAEGVAGRRLDEFLPNADEVGLVDAFRRVAEGGGVNAESEYRFDGFARGPTYWRCTLRRIDGADGTGDLVLLVSEVTEQVQARERIENDRRRLEAVLRTLPLGVFIADASGQLVHANDAARRIWGGKAPLVGPSRFLEYRARWAATGEPLRAGDWAVQRALRTGETSTGELIEIDRFDGKTATILNHAAPVRDADDRIIGAIAAIQDVTELRRAVRHRDEVLQVVSHDLRTPLATVVLGAASLARLSKDAEGPEALERVRTTAARIAVAGRRMNRLIDDLLDMTGLDEGRLSMQRAPTDALDLLGEAADQVREAASEKRLDVCLSAAPGLPRVDCDRDRILQVLGNVASNAVHATAEGCVCLAAEAQGGTVVFRVRDTGPGIPSEDLPHVFDRGRRGEGARWRGSGLGLAIARGLVEAHGGSIWAESAPGEGTTVSFTLPVEAPSSAEAPLALGA